MEAWVDNQTSCTDHCNSTAQSTKQHRTQHKIAQNRTEQSTKQHTAQKSTLRSAPQCLNPIQNSVLLPHVHVNVILVLISFRAIYMPPKVLAYQYKSSSSYLLACLSLPPPSRRYLPRIRLSSPDYQQWSAPLSDQNTPIFGPL